MLAGAVVFALSYGWVKANMLDVANLGKVQLTATGIPAWVWFTLIGLGVAALFVLSRRWARRHANELPAS
jgi:hypothetical protein